MSLVILHIARVIGVSKGGGGARDAHPPWGSKFFHFHAVFGKKLKNNSTFGSWRPPPGENPGSATEGGVSIRIFVKMDVKFVDFQ